MNKIMLVSIISVTFLAGTVLSTSFSIADATGPFCDASNVPKGAPFVDIWFFVCNLKDDIVILQSQTDSLELETGDLGSRVSILESSSGGGDPGPNPIVCPPSNAKIGTGLFGSRAHLMLQNFAGCNLSGLDLRSAEMRYVNLEGADLSGAILTGTNLAGTNLKNANLQGAIISGAILSDANLEGADLQGADLASAHLQNANFAGANLAGVISNSATHGMCLNHSFCTTLSAELPHHT